MLKQLTYSLTILCLCNTLWAGTKNTPTANKVIHENTAKSQYYPQCRTKPLRMGKENYQNTQLSLQGLTGIYINIDNVISATDSLPISLQKDLKATIIQRLNNAGLKLLSKEEMKTTLGQPEMSIYPSFPAYSKLSEDNKTQNIIDNTCCTISIWTTFAQGATTLRDPFTNYKLGTWGTGHNTHDCSDVGGWVSQAVLKTVDAFIEDKIKGDKAYAKLQKTIPVDKSNKKKIIARTPAATENIDCNTSLMMYVELFKTDQTNIMLSKYFILDKLATVMKSCPNYQYTIETHADSRASYAYNQTLSAKRAESIQQLLIAKGVNENQFELKAYGETQPIVWGTSKEDHASNRRVVVTPHRKG